jgi:hypothetical protein
MFVYVLLLAAVVIIVGIYGRVSPATQLSRPWRIVQRVYDAFTIIPWLCLISLGLYVFLVVVEYGHWPQPFNPDPADTSVARFTPVVGYLSVLTVVTSPIWLVVTLLTLFSVDHPLRTSWTRALFYLVPIVISFFLVFHNINWFMSYNNYAGGHF